MEKSTKVKIIVFSIIGSLFLIVVLAFVMTANKRNQAEPEQSTVVHSKVESDFSLDDMMKLNSQKQQHTQPVYKSKDLQADEVYQEEDDDVKRVKNKIEETRQKEDSLVVRYREDMMRTVNEIQNPQSAPDPAPVLTQIPTVSQPIPRDLSIDTLKVVEAEVKKPKKKNRFFNPTEGSEDKNTILATVHGEQTVTNGGTLKMRLLEDLVTVNGTIIPEGSYIFGLVRLNKERLGIEISSVQVENVIIPLSKKVYDMDGMLGIKVPGNLKAEMTTELTESGLNEVRAGYGSGVIDQGINAITRAGTRAFRKANRIVRVTIKSNYKIYLKDEA